VFPPEPNVKDSFFILVKSSPSFKNSSFVDIYFLFPSAVPQFRFFSPLNLVFPSSPHHLRISKKIIFPARLPLPPCALPVSCPATLKDIFQPEDGVLLPLGPIRLAKSKSFRVLLPSASFRSITRRPQESTILLCRLPLLFFLGISRPSVHAFFSPFTMPHSARPTELSNTSACVARLSST